MSDCTQSQRQSCFAKEMRSNPTEAERRLWRRLRHDISLQGTHFRRQAAVGPFIAEFASRKARIVIELDGGQHDERRYADRLRAKKIEAMGYRVLRFWNHDVLANIDGVLESIQNELTPTPDPSPQGGGEESVLDISPATRRRSFS